MRDDMVTPHKLVLVIDLDHTLVHSLPPDQRVPGWKDAFTICLKDGARYKVHVRPGAREFIQHVLAQDWLRVCVWTAGTDDYAKCVVDGLFGASHSLECVLTRKHCLLLPSGSYVKDLNKVRRKLGATDVVLLDDDVVHARVSTNVIARAVPFFATAYGAEHDSFLMQFFNDLVTLRECFMEE